MVKIGLTGGIGAGKSTVAQMFRERGVPVVDADAVARDVVAPGEPALSQLAQRFGAEVVTADGALDRRALAASAFATPEGTSALNAIMHPAIARRSAELFSRYETSPMVVHDVPLLVENGLAPNYHLSLLVDVPAEERVRRLVDSRGLDADDARARIERQATDAQRLAACDVVLDNSGPPEALVEAFTELFAARLAPFADNLRLGIAVPLPSDASPAEANWAAEAARAIARMHRACEAHGLSVAGLRHVGPTASPGTPAADVLDFELRLAGGSGADVERAAADAGFVPCPPDVFADREAASDGGLVAAAGGTFASADPGRPARLFVISDT